MKTFPNRCMALMLFAMVPVACALGAPGQKKPTPAPASASSQAAPAEATTGIADRMRNFSIERRDEALASARRATDELDRQLDRLQAQTTEGWSRMNADTRVRSQRAMADLRARRNTLAEWVGGLQHGSAGAWTEVRSGFAKSYDDLAAALRKARAEFGKPTPDQAQPAPEKDRRNTRDEAHP